MSKTLNTNDPYLNTIGRLEPDIAMIDPGAFHASAAISLRRIADALEIQNKLRAREIHATEVIDADAHDDWLTRHAMSDLIEDDDRRAASEQRVKDRMPKGDPK